MNLPLQNKPRDYIAGTCVLCKKPLPPNNGWRGRVCKECMDKRELEEKVHMENFHRELENKRIKQEKALAEPRWLAACPPRYQDTDEKELPQQLLQKVLSWEYNPTGILLYGETGMAKTRCMYLLVKKMILQKLCKVRVFRPGQFERDCISNFTDGGDGVEWTDRIKDADIVFFDDFLKSKITPRVGSELFQVIDYRHSYKLPILATTNLDPSQMAGQFGGNEPEAFVRRVCEMTDVIKVPLDEDGVV